MARGFRGAGILAGVGKGLNEAGDTILNAVLQSRGLKMREQQLGQQQEQAKQMMGIRKDLAKAYHMKSLLSTVGREDFFSDLRDFLSVEQGPLPFGEQPAQLRTEPRLQQKPSAYQLPYPDLPYAEQ